VTYALFLDDERFPPDDGKHWIIARSVSEAKDVIAAHGWPTHISFDHDLGTNETGKTFADWLVAKDLDGEPVFHVALTWTVHSQNPTGAGNIAGLIDGYLQHKDRDGHDCM